MARLVALCLFAFLLLLLSEASIIKQKDAMTDFDLSSFLKQQRSGCERKSGYKQPQSKLPEGSDHKWAHVNKVVNAVMQCYGVPGMAVAVTKGDKVLFQHAYGVRDLTTNAPVTLDTLFGIGSTTKAFTATYLAMLVEEGVLDWTDKINDLAPYWKYNDDKYLQGESNFLDLLSHRTGIARLDEGWGSGVKSDPIDVIKMTQFFSSQATFRSLMVYNNYMVSAAGRIGAFAANTTWEKAIAHKIFKPLGMKSTTTSTLEAIASGHYAFPNSFNPDTQTVEPYQPPTVNTVIEPVGPAGSIVSSIRDITKWTRFLVNGGVDSHGRQLVQQSSLAFTWEPRIALNGPMYDFFQFDSANWPASFHTQNYALGWLRGDYRGETLIWHDGGTLGHNTLIFVLPARGITAITFSNTDILSFGALPIIYSLLDAALGYPQWINETNACSWPCPWDPACSATCTAPVQDKNEQARADWKKFLETSAAAHSCTGRCKDTSEYEGDYTHPAFGTMTVTSTEDGGIATKYGTQTCTTVDQSGDVFLLSCLSNYYMGHLLRPLQFTRAVNGIVEAVRSPDYDGVIPYITFSRENAAPHLFSYPRYQPADW